MGLGFIGRRDGIAAADPTVSGNAPRHARLARTRAAVMMPAVRMSAEELAARLAEADRERAKLRRATIEWQRVGRRVLAERQHGPERPNDRRAPRR